MAQRALPLLLQGASGAARPAEIAIRQTVIAGWTGRDAAAVESHIVELEALGVKRPTTTPIFYRVASSALTTATEIDVLGEQSSGEVEFVLLQAEGRLWVGTGSDHTDRKVESYGVSVSKQMCEKPVAPLFWAFDDVADHWDRLMLRAFATIGGTRVLYQEGSVAAMRLPADLIAKFAQGHTLAEGTLMFCGTLAVHGGVRSAARFEFMLEDPARLREIRHAYDIVSLPILG